MLWKRCRGARSRIIPEDNGLAKSINITPIISRRPGVGDQKLLHFGSSIRFVPIIVSV